MVGSGNPIGAQRVEVSFVLATQFQVLQATAAAQHVVDQAPHMIRLMVRKVDLEQRKPLVDLFRQLESLGQLVNQPDAAASRADVATRQVVMQVRAAHHGAAHVLREVEAIQSLLDPPLASPHLFCDTVAHSKSSVLLWCVCFQLPQIPHKTPEVSSFFEPPCQSRVRLCWFKV